MESKKLITQYTNSLCADALKHDLKPIHLILKALPEKDLQVSWAKLHGYLNNMYNQRKNYKAGRTSNRTEVCKPFRVRWFMHFDHPLDYPDAWGGHLHGVCLNKRDDLFKRDALTEQWKHLTQSTHTYYRSSRGKSPERNIRNLVRYALHGHHRFKDKWLSPEDRRFAAEELYNQPLIRNWSYKTWPVHAV